MTSLEELARILEQPYEEDVLDAIDGDEDDPEADFAPINEIRVATRERIVTNVAIIGYSHGGGQTFVLADYLRRHVAYFNNYSLVFTCRTSMP